MFKVILRVILKKWFCCNSNNEFIENVEKVVNVFKKLILIKVLVGLIVIIFFLIKLYKMFINNELRILIVNVLKGNFLFSSFSMVLLRK